MTPTAVAAAALAAGAVMLAGPWPSARHAATGAAEGTRRGVGPAVGWVRAGVAGGVGLVVLVPFVSGRHLVLGGIVLLAAAGARQRATRAALAREASQRRQRVVDFAEAVVGELAAGRPVVIAVERSAEVWPEAAPVARAARLGADVPGALRSLATRPGAEGVRRLAAAWELSAASGAGLAQAARRVLETARARQATERLVLAEVASARATARLVCALPVVVLVAAQGAGARPWAFLVGHPLGLACLAAGVALSWGGLTWIDRIASSAVEAAR